MAEGVLYFPYIRVPKNSWFTRVLLYWDQVGSIVPSEYVEKPEALGPYMQELVQAELVKQVFPSQFVNDIPNFTSAFIELIDNHSTIQQILQKPHEMMTTTRIHIEKFGDELADQLVLRGLAKRTDNYLYDVEIVTANLFMAYLASVLGRHPQNQMTPISDKFESLRPFSVAQPRLSNVELVNELRATVLEFLFPAPTESISVGQIADFKSKNSPLLERLRLRTEAHILELSTITDHETRAQRLSLLKKELKEDITELRSKMHERNWPRIVFGTLCGISTGAIPCIEAAVTGNVASALKAIPGLATAIYCAFRESTPRKQVLKSPLAYVALAQEKLELDPNRNGN